MNPLYRQKILISALAILTLSFTACARKPAPPPPPFSVLRVTTPLTHARQKALAATLQSRGVQMIQQGSRLQLILPVNRFFLPQTTTVKEKHIETLRLIALYLHNYKRMHIVHYPIKVYAFSGTVHSRRYRDYESNQYAQVIGSFLWNHGFSPAQLSVVGFGAKHPIASYRTPEGNAFNRRVMIQVN